DVGARHQRVGDDVGGGGGGNQDVRFVAARGDGARQVRLPGDGGVDLLGLEGAGRRRRIGEIDEALLDGFLVVGAQARLRQHIKEQPVRRRVARGGNGFAFQIFNRINRFHRNN